MNRQRAVEYLNALAEHFDDQNLRFIGGDIRESVSALCAPQPDPITGLMPCGCGGKAMIHECHSLSYVIYCDKCKIETNYQLTADTAKDAWNTAMGYRD